MSMEDVLKELQKEYLSALPQKKEEILRSFSQGDVQNMRNVFHKLKGTGSTYGIPEISELSALYETLCTSYQEALAWAIPHALQLLDDIRICREQQQQFVLSADQRFLQASAVVQQA